MSSVRYRGRKLHHQNVQRRLQQWENAEQCAANYGYFKKVNFMTAQHNLWDQADSTGGPRLSKLKEEERQRRLTLRRERLSALFEKEHEQYQRELKEFECHNRQACDVGRLRGINGELRRKEEERQAREAELRLYHRWQQEQPLLKRVSDSHQAEFVRRAWVDQVEERHNQEKKKAEEEKAFEEEHKSRLALQEQAECALIEEKKAQMVELKHVLQCQVDILRKKDEQAKELQAKELLMQKRDAELEGLAKRRRDAHLKRVGLELGMYFQEHYNLKLKRKAREIQESLEEDQRLLREAEAFFNDPRVEEDERREARRHIERANAVLASYAQVEKLIQKDMRALFHEEARFFWDKQEKRWKEEEEARSRLIADTFATLQLQIRERAEKNRLAQEALLHEREDVIRQLENSNTEMERIEAVLKNQQSYRNCLDAQVEDQTLARLAKIKHEEEERHTRLVEMRKEEERLLEEFKRLNTKYPTHPLNFGRKSFIPC